MSKKNYKRVECSYNELLPVDSEKLKPNPKNPNVHSQSQIEDLAKLISDKGQRCSVVISKLTGKMVKGHGTLRAIKEILQWKEVAVEYQDFKTEADEYEHMVADNEIAKQALLDIDKVKEDLPSFDDLKKDHLGIKDFEKKLEENKPASGKPSQEIGTDDFGEDLTHTCPKCGFEFSPED